MVFLNHQYEPIMKKITLLLVIIFTFLFSNTSWGEWTYVTKNVSGDEYYYDKDRVRKSGKYLYVWMLVDFVKPIFGDWSSSEYVQLDCSIFRFKDLRIQTYNKSMGEGKFTYVFTPKNEWRYPQPKSSGEVLYKEICKEHQ